MGSTKNKKTGECNVINLYNYSFFALFIRFSLHIFKSFGCD